MKGIFVILDGLGDLPHRALNYKTPLESAETPNLDLLASHGKLGQMYPVKKGFAPSSDQAIVSIFGNDHEKIPRGQLEARGEGIHPEKGDLALRVNFGTIDNLESGRVLDRRAGRTLTSKEAKKLSKEINKIDIGIPFEFKPSIQHRAVLVLKGQFSEKITENDTTYSSNKAEEVKKITKFKPKDKRQISKETTEALNDFVKKAHQRLKYHKVNKKREKKGLLPANYLFMRSPGNKVPKLKQYKKWMSFGYMPLERGFAELSGMKTISTKYPKLKSIDAYKNLWKAMKKYCKFSLKNLKNHYDEKDYTYIHIKETDLPGHDNKPHVKKEMIEYLDKNFFNKIVELTKRDEKLKVVVTGDHSTPCKLKGHSSDAVPVLFYNNSKKHKKSFSEKSAKKGKMGRFLGNKLFEKTGFKK